MDTAQILRVGSILDYFPQLETLPIEKILGWLKKGYDPLLAENKLGNKLLFPHTLSVTEEDIAFDLALLRVVIGLTPSKYYNPGLKRILIPHFFLEIVPDVGQLIWAFVDALRPTGITTMMLYSTGRKTEVLGTIIKPELSQQKSEIVIYLDQKMYRLKGDNLVIFPEKSPDVFFKFESASAHLEGQSEISAKISGGEAGIIVDTRLQWIKF